MRKLLLLDLAALSPREVGAGTPTLSAFAGEGTLSPLRASFPCLTCTSHASMVTGTPPREHGIVANGWYDREHARIFMWNRSAGLVHGETLWDAARRRAPALRCASLFWRFVADSTCDLQVTERPVYWSSGRKTFDFFTAPSELHDHLVQRLGRFPFMRFWGPFAGIESSRWILDATAHVMESEGPELVLAYAPYLDYEAQRHGPESGPARDALSLMDEALAPLLRLARDQDRDVAIVSDYGFTRADRPLLVNRALREAGYLDVERAANGDMLQPGTSRAFAVCDNQVAHVYVNDASRLAQVRALLEALPGVAEVLGDEGKAARGIDHPRSGDLIAVAEPDAWFAYPYWTDPAREPDFASCIAIFEKTGFDPCELFPRPGPFGKPRIALRVAQKLARMAVPFDVIDTDVRRPKGARNVANEPQGGATLITSWARESAGPVPMESLKALLLERMFEE